MRIVYSPGESIAALAPGFTVLVERSTDVQPLADALWTLAEGAPDIMALLDVLGRDGITSMPAFAAVMVHESHFRIVVRGRYVVDLTRLDGTVETCSAEHVATWSERAVACEQVAHVRVHAGGASGGALLPARSAVVTASCVEVALVEAPGASHGEVIGLASPII